MDSAFTVAPGVRSIVATVRASAGIPLTLRPNRRFSTRCESALNPMPRRMRGVTRTQEESPSRLRGTLFALFGCVLITVPGLIARLSGAELPDVVAPLLCGFAIVGSAFFLEVAVYDILLYMTLG